VRFESNLLTQVYFLLCANEGIPFPGGLEKGFKTLSFDASASHWGIWRRERRKMFDTGRTDWGR
jgi:hypothetical protein